MSLSPHPPVAGYFSAQSRSDWAALAACFAPDGAVRDERRTIVGREAIAQWAAEAHRKYRQTTEPLAVATEGGRTVVRARIAGDFPGSPIELDHIFVLAPEGIASLEIR